VVLFFFRVAALSCVAALTQIFRPASQNLDDDQKAQILGKSRDIPEQNPREQVSSSASFS